MVAPSLGSFPWLLLMYFYDFMLSGGLTQRQLLGLVVV